MGRIQWLLLVWISLRLLRDRCVSCASSTRVSPVSVPCMVVNRVVFLVRESQWKIVFAASAGPSYYSCLLQSCVTCFLFVR